MGNPFPRKYIYSNQTTPPPNVSYSLFSVSHWNFAIFFPPHDANVLNVWSCLDSLGKLHFYDKIKFFFFFFSPKSTFVELVWEYLYLGNNNFHTHWYICSQRWWWWRRRFVSFLAHTKSQLEKSRNFFKSFFVSQFVSSAKIFFFCLVLISWIRNWRVLDFGLDSLFNFRKCDWG